MANFGAHSPDMFTSLDGGLDAFGLGDGTLEDSRLVSPENLVDGSFTSSEFPATAHNTASSTVGEVPASVAASGGIGCGTGTSPISPSAVTASSQEQQSPDLFNLATAPQWTFRTTPPYDSPIGNGDSFGGIPQQTWEFSLGLSQPSQQRPSFYSQSSTASVTAAGNLPGASAFVPILQPAQPRDTRKIQNTLTPAQRERLKSIAMPAHLRYHSPKSAGGSPDSASSHDKGTISSPDAELSKATSRKRKSVEEGDDEDDDDDLDHPVKKTAHNMIEKRYRTNLNDKIAALRDSVPSLRIMCKSARGEDTTEDREELHGLTPAHKLNKATVLSKATEYIRHLEKRNNRLIEENSNMQARIAAFEKLFMAGAMTGQLPNHLQQPPTPVQYPQDSVPFSKTPMATPRGLDPQGLIPIPDDMKRILASQQMNAGRPYPVPAQQFGQAPALLRQQQIQQQQQAQAQAGRWNPYLGKLMVGSLAGLMLVEALVESEPGSETDARGLGSLPPVRFLANFVRSTHFSIGGHHISAIEIFGKLRLVSLLGFFMWLALSSFFDTAVFRPAKKSKGTTSVVKAVPSLASPIHVRRQAWLTAIQTVWVPRHNFILEAAALLLKTLKYALRNVIGVHGYLALVGLSEEQEAARVKAWSIALDAQLAGGDVEINKSRLTLTLIASGTLPDTPLRLMLKALHIRVLLWRLNGACWVSNLLAANLSRARWNEARQINRILNSLPEGEASAEDALPEHLGALLEQDCDDILNDTIIQRAHNLAWNEPTNYNLVDKIDGMDTVVDDAAVRSPMDAVAAWYSNLLLHRVLLANLGEPHHETLAVHPGTADEIALALKLAPIGSNAQVRALVARAVFADGKRAASIVAALNALDPLANPQYTLAGPGVPPMTNVVPDPDAHMALRCAMGMAQLRKHQEDASDLPQAARALFELVVPQPGPNGGGSGSGEVEGMSLLRYAASFWLMEQMTRHPVAREACSRSLERLAGCLRIWVGSDAAAGEKSGLDAGLRRRLIERCLAVTKSVVGMETDPGYGSMEECEEGEGEGEGGC
ncbi:hypothetical protein N658DRAFT_557768 [Parathielavia hyrcaniae]|uniref:BHLH domain-containing protein n=1 Tax=Parathielavia hyrcaniae TaxID=113614 RepID=A0AAN6T3C7_9PEZI|nr:hypothetical protein N658DRAFT_557768 [Parathielavia hyrcaniae]